VGDVLTTSKVFHCSERSARNIQSSRTGCLSERRKKSDPVLETTGMWSRVFVADPGTTLPREAHFQKPVLPLWSKYDAVSCTKAHRWENTTDGYSFRFFSPEQVDQILCDGAKRGRAGSHAAIERILKHEPGLERADLWQRIRRLKHPANPKRTSCAVWAADEDDLLRKGYAEGWAGKKQAIRELLRRHPDWQPYLIWRRASQLGLVQRSPKRHQERSQHSWSEHDDRVLLNLAGYKGAAVIAKILHRSANAIRSRLSRLGKSSRVHKEGYAQRALSEELHFGSRTIRALIIAGLLEVRDPRITGQSMRAAKALTPALIRTDHRGTQTGNVTEILLAGPIDGESVKESTSDARLPNSRPPRSSRADRIWTEAANEMGISLQKIKNCIAQGLLKLCNPRITEKSLRNLCRRHGSLVNYDYLNRETQAWLDSSMDFIRNGGEARAGQLSARRQHAQVVRHCHCGREIRGNAFFRHARKCGERVRTDPMAQAFDPQETEHK
jgi:hypothetical protein